MSLPHYAINAMHFAIIGPAIGYVGLKAKKDGEIKIGKKVAWGLIILALVIILFHLYRFVTVSWPEHTAPEADNTSLLGKITEAA